MLSGRGKRGWATATLAMFMCVAFLCATSAVAAAEEQTDTERALLSFNALQQAYYLPWHHLYRGESGASSGAYSYLFPFTQALAATTAVVGIPALAERSRAAVSEHLLGLRWYWNPRSKPPGYESGVLAAGGAEKYYDDNEWAGLQLVRGYRMLGDHSLLAKAAEVFQLVVYGWDKSRTHPCPGGVWWTQRANTFTRNTVSNAPGAELGLELYQITGRRAYLQWARRMYHWVRVCLRESVGLYADKIDLSGHVDEMFWIYNQGTMIGAEALLYEATRDRAYLEGAIESAAATLAYFTTERVEHQPPYFVSIFADNLMRLNAIAPNPAYAAYLQTYANHVWEADRNTTTGLFEFHEQQPSALVDQAAMTQLYAYLSWDGRWYAPPPVAPAPAPPAAPSAAPPHTKEPTGGSPAG